MSDKEGDSYEDIQNPIEFTILQSETKSFQVPPDQDVFFTNAELVNIQPDSSNKVVILSIDYEVVYFNSENSSENEDEINTDANTNIKNTNLNKDNEETENIDTENISFHKQHRDTRTLKKALDHIIISIPISSSLSSVSDLNSMNNASSIQISNSNQNSTLSSSQQNPAENYFSSNLLNQNYNINSNASSNSMPIQIQFCPDMNPVFHVNGPADVKLTGFTAPTSYNFIEEEESENDEDEDNIQDGNQIDQNDDEKIDKNENFNKKDKLDSIEIESANK